MAYNHGREDRKWRIWKEAEEKVLRECGVDEAVIEQISFNTDDYFKLTIMVQYAEQESRKISERVFSGQATAMSNGVHFGKD